MVTAAPPSADAEALLVTAHDNAIARDQTVIVKSSKDPRDLAASKDSTPKHVFVSALNGFAAHTQ